MSKCLLVLLLIISAGCKIDKNKAVDRAKFTFKTGDDTELFFKNVRQSDYDLEENDVTKFKVFRHRKWHIYDSIPSIKIAIVLNVLQDEAYVLTEPSESLLDDLRIRISTAQGVDSISLIDPNRENILEFATRIYEGILMSAHFEAMGNNGYVEILKSNQERESFRITMSDYYRLTRIY